RHLNSFPTRRSSDLREVQSRRGEAGGYELLGQALPRPVAVARVAAASVTPGGDGERPPGRLSFRGADALFCLGDRGADSGDRAQDRKSTRLNSSHLV